MMGLVIYFRFSQGVKQCHKQELSPLQQGTL
ncbi:hypothetical protein Pan241w_20070 [Gimesia alba]|uniref:Uncharacterized protein n=1 Tax=Gimesia alba TaxID=2527973 RepID=A0A517RDH1_9PLAN|nr:hypothetical protein Pan241w_20070 [Gimesia alba]